MAERYGVPYKGSKNQIAEFVVMNLPKAETLVDIFAGGCAITHAAMCMTRYRRFVLNDLHGDALKLFTRAIRGEYRDETRWISREDFKRLKDTDPYVTVCWSFGNNIRDYLYSEEIEPWKKALHYARVFGDRSLLEDMGIRSAGSRRDIREHEEEYRKKYIRWFLSRQGYTEAELDALIAKCKGDIRVQEEDLRQYMLRGLASSGLTQAEVGKRLGTQMQGHYFGRSQWAFPTEEYYRMMQEFMPALDKDYNEIIGLTRLRQSLGSLGSLQSLEHLGSLGSLEHLERLERLQSLEHLQSLGSLQSLESLPELRNITASFTDYREVEIPAGAVIYCDPPYKGTGGYIKEAPFDHEAFYDWCCRQKELVVISEYDMPAGRFTCVAKRMKNVLITGSDGNGQKRAEQLFVPRRQEMMYRRMMGESPGAQLSLFPMEEIYTTKNTANNSF